MTTMKLDRPKLTRNGSMDFASAWKIIIIKQIFEFLDQTRYQLDTKRLIDAFEKMTKKELKEKRE